MSSSFHGPEPGLRDVFPVVAPTTDSWPAAPPLTRHETAYGLAVGRLAERRTPDVSDLGSVAEEFDRCLRAALARPPCLISFSGGRDSSALLAWAVDLARREGWELPVPATLVAPHASDTDEADWQRVVLEHLGLTERVMFRMGDDLDCVGPVATSALQRHGVLWPFNTHMHIPIFGAAAGGSVVTGFGGDELGRSSQLAVRAAQLVAGRRRPHPVDAMVLGLAAAPPAVRRAVFTRRARNDLGALPWLTIRAATELAVQMGRADAQVPRRWDRILTSWWPYQRYYQLVEQSFTAAASPWQVEVLHPFTDLRILTALARVGGWAGLGTRAELMTAIFGELVPAEILHRLSKAAFSNVLYTQTARDFVREWSGEGLDEELVDVRRLRAHWLADGAADMRSMALLQTAWLHDHGSGATGKSPHTESR